MQPTKFTLGSAAPARLINRKMLVRLAYALASSTLMFVTYLYVLGQPLNHDVAWLLEATQRWTHGAELYRDIIEINPPLIFIDNVLLSAGLLSKASYLAGVLIAVALSSAWVGRWRGPYSALVVTTSLIFTAIGDFGQRDHLALIFLSPFLLAPDGIRRRERLALAVWAFLGVGLKPHFVLIPVACAVGHCIKQRSIAPIWWGQNLALATMCIAWLFIAFLIWPAYFTEILPLGSAVYGAFGNPIGPQHLILGTMVAALTLLVGLRQATLLPVACGALAGVAVYLIQGRFWSYHLIPALGATAITVWLAALRDQGVMRLGFVVSGAALLTVAPMTGLRKYDGLSAPKGVGTVLFLSDRVTAAYPGVTECGIRNVSASPTYWTLPGAWNTNQQEVFAREIGKMNREIERGRPVLIFEDMRLRKFVRRFRFRDWADLTDYRLVAAAQGPFAVWLRKDISPAVLKRPDCD
jgi:hypothetical protein